ncbi:MAG: heavy metal-responsive transcriptional regulator [Cyanophyceae cyanobacterium]
MALKIGDVATQSGLSVKTVRYYADFGLLAPAVERAASGYRLFHPSVFNRLAFIRRSQSLGLNLHEIKDILAVHDAGEIPCGAVKQRLIHKQSQINRQIESLQLLKAELQGILSGWQEEPLPEQFGATICPNIQLDKWPAKDNEKP